MPIYEYQCVRCAAVRDIKHGFKETTAETCSVCDGELKRLFNPAGIVFKGSGFYINDSRKPSAEAKSETKTADAAPKTEKTETKSEPKGKGDAAA